MFYPLSLTITWVLFLGVYAFSTDHTGGVKLPSKFIEVQKLTIESPQPHSEHWLVSISTEVDEIKLIAREHWQFSDEEVHSKATKGQAYMSDGDSWQLTGWSRMVINTDTIEHDARGSFEVMGEIWHLTEHTEKGYIIWKENELALSSDFASLPDSEGPSDQQHIIHPRAIEAMNLHPYSRSLLSSIGNTTGCPRSPFVARIGVAADMNFMKSFSSTVEARTHIIDTINKASQVWEQAFNISLVLGDLILANDSYRARWNTICGGADDNVNALQTRLTALSEWRAKTTSRVGDGLAQWTLFTDCPSGNVVGLAWQSTACNVSAANVVHHSLLDYRVLAHETGHVFGAVHDCTNASCAQNGKETQLDTAGSAGSCCPYSADSCDAGAQFIMNPASNLQQFMFSPCSQGNVCNAIGSGTVDASCLVPQGSNRTNTTEPTNTCSSDLTWDRFRACRQDMQCIEVTGQQESYACGSSESCMMWCFDSRTNQCVEQDRTFTDRTPCGIDARAATVCLQGRCGYNRPSQRRPSQRLATWIWILILVLSIVVALALLGVLLLVRCHKVHKRNGNHKAAQVAAIAPEKQGFPDLNEHGSHQHRNIGSMFTHKPPTHSTKSPSCGTAGSDYILKDTQPRTEYGSDDLYNSERVAWPKSVFNSNIKE